MKRKILIFIGAPASGKGTRIKECIGYKQVSVSRILRKNGYNLSNGGLVDDQIVNNLIIREIRKSEENIILDGFPRTENQFLALLKNNIFVDKVFYINTPIEILFQRVRNRLTCINCQASFTKDTFRRPKIDGICDYCGGKLVERLDDSEELFKKRLDTFEKHTKPLIRIFKEYNIPIIYIDGTLPPSEILKLI